MPDITHRAFRNDEFVLPEAIARSDDAADQDQNQRQMEREGAELGPAVLVGIDMGRFSVLLGQDAVALFLEGCGVVVNRAVDWFRDVAVGRNIGIANESASGGNGRFGDRAPDAGARFMVQTVIAIVRIARMSMNGIEWKTSQAYQRSTMPSVAGTASAIQRGTELPRSVPMRTSTARIAISITAARTEQKNRQTRSTSVSSGIVAKAAFLECGLRHQEILVGNVVPVSWFRSLAPTGSRERPQRFG